MGLIIGVLVVIVLVSWDYLFISTNIRTLCKIPYVTTGHAVDLLRDDNV